MGKIIKLGKMLFSVLLGTFISLALVGCNKDIRESQISEQPAMEQTTSEESTEEHHSSEHPSSDHPH